VSVEASMPSALRTPRRGGGSHQLNRRGQSDRIPKTSLQKLLDAFGIGASLNTAPGLAPGRLHPAQSRNLLCCPGPHPRHIFPLNITGQPCRPEGVFAYAT